MKLPTTDPLSLAALEVAKETLDRKDSKNTFLYRSSLDDFEFQFQSTGVVGIKTASSGKTLTLSPKAYFGQNPVVLVKASTGKIFIGPKAYPIPEKVKNTEAYRLLENTKLKGYSPSSL